MAEAKDKSGETNNVKTPDDMLVAENKELKNRLSKLEKMFNALTQQVEEKSKHSFVPKDIEPEEEIV
ncbi:MAG: hypothetical protein ACOYJ1_14535, partial [Peptococcales bacterium]